MRGYATRATGTRLTRACVVLLALATVVPVTRAHAQDGEASGSFVHVTGVRDDVVFAAGGQVRIEAQVSDDIVVAGGLVDIETTTAEDAMVAGGTVTLRDVAVNDLYLAGGTLDIAAAIGDDAAIFGGTVRLRKETTVGGSARIAGGRVEVRGRVAGRLRAAAGEIILDGQVGGDVDLVADRITIGPDARIAGKLRYASRHAPEISESARIEGGVEERPVVRHRDRGAGGIVGFLLFAAAVVVGLGLLGLALHAAIPRLLDDASERLAARPFESLGIGLAFAVLVPLASIVLVAVVIGAPVALLALFVLAVLMPPSGIVLAYRIALWARHRLASAARAPTLAARSLWTVAGIVVLLLIFAIPFVGAALVALAGCAALGALAMQAGRRLA